MLKKWIEDIRVKTEKMDRAQKIEYVMAYYWYHILIAVILLILSGLLIYHFTIGNHKILFSLAIINQEVDYERDEKILKEFSKSYGIKSSNISVDSDYLLSYDNIQIDNANESLFEKFFFGWNAGAIDAVIMPESFLKYCSKNNGEFMELLIICLDLSPAEMEEKCYKHNGVYTGIYIDKTKLAKDFISEREDPLMLVFTKNSKHFDECTKFAEFIMRD